MWYFLILLAILPLVVIPPAYGQEIITVNETTPCFLNYTATFQMWENCGADEDFLEFSLLGWEWVTGGYFSMFIVSILIFFTYVKYHKAIYPLFIGIMFLPISWFLFPDSFLTWAILMGGAVVFILLWYTFIKQTKEY